MKLTLVMSDGFSSDWYVSCRRFPTPELARKAYLRIMHFDSSGHLDIGVYRHQRIGLDPGALLVSVVGLRLEGVEKAQELLGGEETELHPDSWLQLIARRAEVIGMLLSEDAPGGRYEIYHGDEGMKL